MALRPEPFGALAYHYGSRRLTFLRSVLLADVVRDLEHHGSAESAVSASVPAGATTGLPAGARLSRRLEVYLCPLTPLRPDWSISSKAAWTRPSA